MKLFKAISAAVLLFSFTACGKNCNCDATSKKLLPWHCKDCCEDDEEEVVEVPPCRGINNSSCELEFTEDSIWRSLASSANKILTIKHYYTFKAADRSWSHYMFVPIPTTKKFIMEKREGKMTFFDDPEDLSNFAGSRDRMTMTVESSTCEDANESVFAIMDQERTLSITRLDLPRLALNHSREFLTPFSDAAQNILAKMILVLVDYIMNILILPFTPEFWENVILGQFVFEAALQSELDKDIENGFEGCFSEAGVLSLIESGDFPNEEISIPQP